MIIRTLDNRILATGKNSEFKLLSDTTSASRLAAYLEAVSVKPKGKSK